MVQRTFGDVSREAMSALGQKQTCAVQNAMSALPPKADMCGACRYVRFVPKADLCTAVIKVIDHLIVRPTAFCDREV